MKTRLGPYTVYPVGLGFWQAAGPSWGTRRAPAPVGEIVGAALEEGIDFFDTAEIYGWGRSEELLGKALRSHGSLRDVVIATKAAGFRWTRHGILKAARASARRLGRPPDLLQHHWPPPVPGSVCRVARALEEAVARGLAGAWGLSNYPGGLLERAAECARRTEPVSDQVQYSLAYRVAELDVFPAARSLGARVIAWSPLAKGALAGAERPTAPAQKRDPVFREAARDKVLQDALDRVAARHGATRAQVALAWIVARGAVPIPGTRRPGRVREYAAAARLRLGEEDLAVLDEASSRYRARWGRSYRALQWLRLVPAPLQYIVIRASGGV